MRRRGSSRSLGARMQPALLSGGPACHLSPPISSHSRPHQPCATSPLLFCTLLHSFRPQTVLKSSNANLFRSKPLPLPCPTPPNPPYYRRPGPSRAQCVCPSQARRPEPGALSPRPRRPRLTLAPLANPISSRFNPASQCHSLDVPPWCDWALLMCRHFFFHLVTLTAMPLESRGGWPAPGAAGPKGPSAECWRQRTVFCCFASCCPTATPPCPAGIASPVPSGSLRNNQLPFPCRTDAANPAPPLHQHHTSCLLTGPHASGVLAVSHLALPVYLTSFQCREDHECNAV